jgi:serine/threonine protein kinase
VCGHSAISTTPTRWSSTATSKSTNVLLDSTLDVHLSNFGLVLCVPKRMLVVFTAMMTLTSTLSYLDLAYITPGSLSTKTDVFSFGILLLEIMGGRKAIDLQTLW